MKNILLLGGSILSYQNKFKPIESDLLIKNGRIAEIKTGLKEKYPEIECLDCSGKFIIPGFVQAHVHMAQVMFRGLGEGLTLLEWLQKKILPLEASHDEHTLYNSARLGMAELLLGGNTTMLDMGSVHHMDSIFVAAKEMGIGIVGGKIMMDSGNGVPEKLIEKADVSLKETERLLNQYNMTADGLIRYAVAPRFLLSCTHDLMKRSIEIAIENDVIWHTHVAEQIAEVGFVRSQTKKESIELLDLWGAKHGKLALAHMIHLTDNERRLLKTFSHVGILHCPRANTRLGSGICSVPELLAEGYAVGIGSDGSACNNKLDMFEEMRAAAALQDLRLKPGSLTSSDLLYMATMGGAKAIGLGDETGSIEEGKRADLVILDPLQIAFVSEAEPVDMIVHNGDARMVKTVLVNGQTVVSDGELVCADKHEIVERAKKSMNLLVERTFQS